MILHSRILGLSALCGGLLSSFASPAAAAPVPARIVIDATRPLGPVPSDVFGHNVEAADGAGIFSGTSVDALRTGNGFWDPATGKASPLMAEAARAAGMRMLRYPGGCLAHNFDWRKTVGPIEHRGHPEWRFGLDEYLALCRELKLEPMLTLSDYVLPAEEMPAHLAELVEYLNAPATPAHPWAMKRAEWGHPEPWGVKWFELGNESDHGNHNVKPWRIYSAGQYADYAVKSARAMKAVDPTIKVGVQMEPGISQEAYTDWNRTVARVAGPEADFVIIHIYSPHVVPAAVKEPALVDAAMALPEQLAFNLGEYRRMFVQECGRALPFAITEFNMGAIPDKPKPYRYSFAAALQTADMIRVFLQPGSGVVSAHYWQFNNGHWGMVRTGAGERLATRPAYLTYRLWGEHFGATLLPTEVASPVRAAAAFPGVYDSNAPAFESGGRMLARYEGAALSPLLSVRSYEASGIPARLDENAGLVVNVADTRQKRYMPLGAIPRPEGAEGALTYTLSYEARFVGDAATAKFSLGLNDSRGYNQTGSAALISHGVTSEWRTYSGRYRTLTDTPGAEVVNRLEDTGGVTGRLEIRGIVVEVASGTRFPAYPLLTSAASLSADGETLYVIVINKSETDDLAATIETKGFAATSAKVWEVSAPSMAAIEGVAQTKSGAPAAVSAGVLDHMFPARSMTAIELRR